MRCARPVFGTRADANTSGTNSVDRGLRGTILVTSEICRAERSCG
jgi:hypothetical protein